MSLRALKTDADLELCLKMGRKFWERGPYSGRDCGAYVEDDMRQTFLNIMQEPTAAVFLTDTAMIGGLLSPLFFNKTHIVAHELFWWSEKGSRDGARVRKAFEAWAELSGAAEVLMTCLADDDENRMRSILERRHGYEALECKLRKRTSWQSEQPPQ